MLIELPSLDERSRVASIERVDELVLPLETPDAGSRFTRSAVEVPVEPDVPELPMLLPVPVAAASRFTRSAVELPVVPVVVVLVVPVVPVVPMLSAARGVVEFGVVDVDGLTTWPFVCASVAVEGVVGVVVCANAKLAAAAAAQINSLGDFMQILLEG